VSGKVATANLLRGGEIVYFTVSGEWSKDLQQARIAPDDGALLLEEASRGEEDQIVVSLYLIEVEESGGHLSVLSQRERIRAAGPTV
tara:strand:- start:445 stop:705 length:261 start_codon:yes stop_codon:yes gene_type:complete